MAALLTMNIIGLDDYLETVGSRPVRWGTLDCCMFVADWVEGSTGVDPARDWRGLYASEREAHRLIKRRGGFVAAIGDEMDRHGFARTDDPMSGDVGIAEVPVAVRRGVPVIRPVGAIRFGRLWVVKSLLGLAAEAFPTVAAWRIDRSEPPTCRP